MDEIEANPFRDCLHNQPAKRKLIMNNIGMLAVTVVGEQHRFFGLDWSYLSILGFIGNAVFAMRFIAQWAASEKRGESVIPVSFWYWSIGGSVLMGLYFLFRRDPVGILAYVPNSLIYFRNLQLIRRKKLAATAATASRQPIEESD